MDDMTVLIVDDDEDIVRSLGIRLTQERYKVVAAQDANQAVMQAHKLRPDLLILDIGMPAGSGFTVMQNLSNSMHTQTIPVIVLTALDDEETRDTAENLGARGYFVKPYDFNDLLLTVNEILD